jgi:hypothetical protein
VIDGRSNTGEQPLFNLLEGASGDPPEARAGRQTGALRTCSLPAARCTPRRHVPPIPGPDPSESTAKSLAVPLQGSITSAIPSALTSSGQVTSGAENCGLTIRRIAK